MLERRSEERTSQVYLPACFEVSERFHVGLIRDMSDTGIGIEADHIPPIGSPIRVQWGNIDPVEGFVKWSEAGRFGVACTTDRKVASFDRPYRPVRVPVGLPAEVRFGDRSESGEVLNLSTKGLAISFFGSARLGQLAAVYLGHHAFQNCIVRWHRNGVLGLSLERTIRLSTLSSIVRESQSYLRAAA